MPFECTKKLTSTDLTDLSYNDLLNSLFRNVLIVSVMTENRTYYVIVAQEQSK